MRPRIGVSGPDFGGFIAWVFTWFAIARAGGRAVRLTPRRRQSLGQLDGLVIGGGVDIAETLPEDEESLSEPRSLVRRLFFRLTAPFRSFIRAVLRLADGPKGDLARDMLEVRLLRTAAEDRIPTLGICRGAQMMARIEHGTLAQDVGARFEDREMLWTPLPSRDIIVEDDSRLHERLGGAEHRVNSLHRHAVESVPAPMRIVAREANAPVTQAIEHPERPFWLGVQWHPEYMPQDASQQRLFADLVACAAQRRRRTDSAPRGERQSAAEREVGSGAHPTASM
jgi:putative glutamine amidotransferase